MTPLRRFPVLLAVGLLASPLLAGSPKPIGTWKRESAPVTITVNISETKLTARVAIQDGDVELKAVLDAEYSLTSDGVLYGVVTCIDGSPLPLAQKLGQMDGQPFAMRVKVDGSVLHVREVKCAGADQPFADLLPAIAGRYEAVEAPKTMPDTKPVTRVVKSPPVFELPLPHAAPIVPLVPEKIEPFSGYGSESLPVPSHIRKQWERDTTTAAPIQRVGVDFNTNPPTFFPPRSAALPTETWIREVPGVRTRITLTDRRLKAEVEMAIEDGKDVQRGTIHLDADCAVTPEGMAFGVVTSLDVSMPDDAPAKHRNDMRKLAEMMSAVNDAMFKFRYRIEGDVLTARELRLMAPGEEINADATKQIAFLVGGRYKRLTSEPLPALKPGKPFCEDGQCVPEMPPPLPARGALVPPPGVSIVPAGMPLPSPGYLQQVPQSSYPDADFPLQRELVPTMPPIRLIEDSEDLRQLRDHWQRFWFNDTPKTPAPERLRGAASY